MHSIILYNLTQISLIIFSIIAISTSSPVLSVCSLIIVYISAAFYISIIGISYISLTLIVLYVGAVALLLLFVLILINLRYGEKYLYSKNPYKNIPIGFFLGIFFLAFITPFLPFNEKIDFITSIYNYFNNSVFIISDISYDSILELNQLSSIGLPFYTIDSILLILCGLILILSIIAAIVLSIQYK